MASYQRRSKPAVVTYACILRVWDIEEEGSCEFGDYSLVYGVCSRSAWTLREQGVWPSDSVLYLSPLHPSQIAHPFSHSFPGMFAPLPFFKHTIKICVQTPGTLISLIITHAPCFQLGSLLHFLELISKLFQINISMFKTLIN